MKKELLLPANHTLSTFRVLNPNGKYSGQKPMKLVKIKAAETTSRTIANVPEIISL
jgi:hypothetical protein